MHKINMMTNKQPHNAIWLSKTGSSNYSATGWDNAEILKANLGFSGNMVPNMADKQIPKRNVAAGKRKLLKSIDNKRLLKYHNDWRCKSNVPKTRQLFKFTYNSFVWEVHCTKQTIRIQLRYFRAKERRIQSNSDRQLLPLEKIAWRCTSAQNWFLKWNYCTFTITMSNNFPSILALSD